MLRLVNRPSDISLPKANQSQAKFKSAVEGNLPQSWVTLTIIHINFNAVRHQVVQPLWKVLAQFSVNFVYQKIFI